MRCDLVALDLETTGLDVATDAIVEVGAVRMRNGEIIEEYGTLVNPGFVIPSETTRITGIVQDELRDAPLLTAVLPEISAFVGDAPVIAHNVSFDIAFMRRFGVLKDNLPIDTYELASILLPAVPRYSLSSLCDYLSIPLENAHRALDDARASALLYWRLWEKLLTIPAPILQQAVIGMERFRWDTGQVFRSAWEEASQDISDEDAYDYLSLLGHTHDLEEGHAGSQNHTLVQERAEVVSVFSESGALSRSVDGFKFREQQVEMVNHVLDALENDNHILIEADTGIGKSLAYLAPAIWWSLKTKSQVVVSTNTTQLQEQLLRSDIAALHKALPEISFKAAVMKGREHYLCAARLRKAQQRQLSTLDLHVLLKILVWLFEGGSGDRSEITLRADEYASWERLSAANDECALKRCSGEMDGICPYYKARKQAETAQIIIANHALLIADARSEQRVLPEYKYLIVDEAHRFEQAVTNGLNQRLDLIRLEARLRDLGSVNAGTLGDLLLLLKHHIPVKHVLKLEAFVQDIGATISGIRVHIQNLHTILLTHLTQSGDYRVRLDHKWRESESFPRAAAEWELIDSYLQVVIGALAQLRIALDKLAKFDVPSLQDYQAILQTEHDKLTIAHATTNRLVQATSTDVVCWLSGNEITDSVIINTAPIHIGSMMHEFIWGKKDAVILTGATLRTNGDFTFIRDRLDMHDGIEFVIEPVFDYQKAVKVYVPDDIPMPNEIGAYQKSVERGIVELAAALDGRVMVLFTSFAQLKETAANVGPRLALGDITLYDQASGGGRESLLENFISTEKAVLFGTRSFWEGVDIPGTNLSALIIVRLPFSVPNDPVFSARSSTYKNSFKNYAVPDAILRFRQGFGRLIRTHTDKGIVAIFDSRIAHKSYGARFLDALPRTDVEYGSLDNLAEAAKRWLEN